MYIHGPFQRLFKAKACSTVRWLFAIHQYIGGAATKSSQRGGEEIVCLFLTANRKYLFCPPVLQDNDDVLANDNRGKLESAFQAWINARFKSDIQAETKMQVVENALEKTIGSD